MIIRLFFFFFLSLFLLNCKEDKVTQSLSGKWYFNTVYRNQKETKTLEGGFFNFLSDTTMQSNVLPSLGLTPYDYDGKSITVHSDETYKFNILKHTKDTLVVTGYMNSFEMKFLMTSAMLVDSTVLERSTPIESEI